VEGLGTVEFGLVVEEEGMCRERGLVAGGRGGLMFSSGLIKA
jgi:hypothetical protein